MVSYSLTWDSWKVKSLRPKLESLTNGWSIFTLKGKNQLFTAYIPSFQGSVHVFYKCFPVKKLGLVDVLGIE